MLSQSRTWKKKTDLMNLHSKASWNKNKAFETLRFVCFTEKGLEGFRLSDSLCQCFGEFFTFKKVILINQLTLSECHFFFITSF